MIEQTGTTTIGRYELVRELGRGAMGRVYLAYDPHLNRQVAIKLIVESGLDDAYFWKAFQREAKLIGSLRHPNILTVYDFGTDYRQSYLVMEYVDGGLTLEHAMKDGPLFAEDVCAVVNQLAGALSHAHQAGLVHRDIKPANVLVDKSAHIYLSDFGLAKAVEDARGTSLGSMGSLTIASVGTPAYMSPEQIRGETAIDHRADLYALGITAFELLTGNPPFTGHLDEIIYHHCNAPVPSAAARNHVLPLAVDAVLERALAKEPADRYGSAVDFAAALQEALADVLTGMPAPPHIPGVVITMPPPTRSSTRDSVGPATGAGSSARPVTATGRSSLADRASLALASPARDEQPTAGPDCAPVDVAAWLARPAVRWWVGGLAALVPLIVAALLLWPALAARWGSARGPLPGGAELLTPYGSPWTSGVILAPSEGFPNGTYVPPAGARWPPPWVPPGSPPPPVGTAWPPPGAPLGGPLGAPAPGSSASASLLTSPVGSGPVKIVSSMPRTGDHKGQSDLLVDAYKLALEEANHRAGDLAIRYEDWHEEPDTQVGLQPQDVVNPNRAVADPDVMLYLGPVVTVPAPESLAVLNQAGIAAISPVATWPGLTKPLAWRMNEPERYYPTGRRHFARVIPTDDVQARLSARWAGQLGVTSVYLLDDGFQYSRGIAASFAEGARANGLTIVGQESFTAATGSYADLASRLRERQPQLVYIGMYAENDAGRLWREVRAALPNAKLMAAERVATAAWLGEAGPVAEGTYFVSPFASPEQFPGGAALVKRYRDRYGRDPDGRTAYAYEAARVALDAIKRAGKKDREAIRQALLSTQRYAGVLGTWSFDPNGDVDVAVHVGTQVENGRFLVRETFR